MKDSDRCNEWAGIAGSLLHLILVLLTYLFLAFPLAQGGLQTIITVLAFPLSQGGLQTIIKILKGTNIKMTPPPGCLRFITHQKSWQTNKPLLCLLKFSSGSLFYRICNLLICLKWGRVAKYKKTYSVLGCMEMCILLIKIRGFSSNLHRSGFTISLVP